ncbi:putative imidazole glycerol phosphate synthase [Actinobacillus pleuropneumoniae]|nr:putative imidazole glycerol phosphate synthase [Actinobacillus pleuropneumoniae]KIE93857.1 putative imidazole glycerol phosphate synthase [Actinobacillus pleuropneumoniae]KIE94803.1 putative imidazole glycerol phosphate synthase [Actinobacillus pleuropneumoniae]KIF00067.1 putative imidazole glycerol phosphate synthase [Actinobacillus pleuropneumoniae]
MNLVIINTGCANLSSVKFAFDRLGIQAEISCDLDKIKSADKLLLPGVGTAAAAMKILQDRDLIDTIRNATQPMLGICLGMQLMTEFSAEGDVDTLKLMSGKTELIPNTGLPLPHMGWNKVQYQADHPLFHGIEQNSHFYFVHSYAVLPNENTMLPLIMACLSRLRLRAKTSTAYSSTPSVRAKMAHSCCEILWRIFNPHTSRMGLHNPSHAVAL